MPFLPVLRSWTFGQSLLVMLLVSATFSGGAGCLSSEPVDSDSSQARIGDLEALPVLVLDDLGSVLDNYNVRATARDWRAPYRVGFNMIRLTSSETSERFDTSEEVLADIESIGGQGIRQLQDRDVSWFGLYDGGDYGVSSSYDFSDADEMLASGSTLYPIPTLFQIGNSSQGHYFDVECESAGSHGLFDSKYCKQPYTPSGDLLKVSNDDVAEAVEGYLAVVAERYAPLGVLHYEIGNEWELQFKHDDYLIDFNFAWEPSKYVDLLALSRSTLHAVDPDIRLVYGGLSFLDNYDADARQEVWEDWFDKTLDQRAGEYFDILSFHFYGEWIDLRDHIDELKELMEDHGIEDKPLWLTEVGSSATTTSEEQQSQNVFKFFSVAFGNGVELINWHTHLSSNDGTSNWGGYGVRRRAGQPYASLYSYQLFAEGVGDFSECRAIREGTNGLWAYRYAGRSQDGREVEDAIVMWSESGERTYDLSTLFRRSDVVEVTETVPNSDGTHTSWQVSGDEILEIDETPVLLIVTG